MLAGFDSALCANFSRFRKSGVAPEVWVAANADQLEVVVCQDDLLPVLQCAGDYKSVGPQLERMSKATRTGDAAFQFWVRLVGAHDFKIFVDECLQEVRNLDFSIAAVEACRSKFQTKANGVKSGGKVRQQKRVVETRC